MSSTRSGIVAVAVAAVLALQALPAQAQSGTAADPNDVKGKLDIASLHYDKDSAKAPLVIVITTYGKWGKRVLARHSGNRLLVKLDVDRDGMSDYHASIKESGGKLYVHIAGSGQQFEDLRAHKPDPKTVRFTIPGESPPNPKGPAPKLRAYSRFIGSLACDPASGNGPCVDHAPDHGWL
jgi:hypothetical protein